MSNRDKYLRLFGDGKAEMTVEAYDFEASILSMPDSFLPAICHRGVKIRSAAEREEYWAFMKQMRLADIARMAALAAALTSEETNNEGDEQ